MWLRHIEKVNYRKHFIRREYRMIRWNRKWLRRKKKELYKRHAPIYTGASSNHHDYTARREFFPLEARTAIWEWTAHSFLSNREKEKRRVRKLPIEFQWLPLFDVFDTSRASDDFLMCCSTESVSIIKEEKARKKNEINIYNTNKREGTLSSYI